MPPEAEGAPNPELTQFLKDLSHGQAQGESQLMPKVVEELKAIARGYLAGQRAGHTLQPSALVNEAYLKIIGRGHDDWKDRAHFFALAARAMRQILVDHARRKRETARGGDSGPISIAGPVAGPGSAEFDLLDLDAALEELSALDARQGSIVELKYFGELEVTEVAEVLQVSKTTVEREWRVARAWLGDRLSGREKT